MIDTITELQQRDVGFRRMQEQIDTTTPGGKLDADEPKDTTSPNPARFTTAGITTVIDCLSRAGRLRPAAARPG